MSGKTRFLPIRAWRERSPLTKRLLSAGVMIPLALGVVWLGGAVFAMFVGLAAIIMAREWGRICTGARLGMGEAVLAAGLVAVTALAALGEPPTALVAGAVAAAFSTAHASGRMRRGRLDGLWMGFGALYLAVAVVAALWLRNLPGGFDAFMWLMLLVWSTDTGAYAFGKMIGGPAFAPRFSPQKTWAGVGGGVFAAVVAGLLAAELGFRPHALGIAGTGELWRYAVLFAIAVQSGDILESAAKRHFRVKDTGTLIPGHGGALDRLDGFLLAVSVAALCALLHGGAA